MPTYTGKKNAMKVMANRSGNMTFKIPAESADKRTSLVSLSKDQLEELRDQIDDHLEGKTTVDFSANRKAIQDQIDALRAMRGDHSDVIDALEEAIANLN